jgi:hypothetical protein
MLLVKTTALARLVLVGTFSWVFLWSESPKPSAGPTYVRATVADLLVLQAALPVLDQVEAPTFRAAQRIAQFKAAATAAIAAANKAKMDLFKKWGKDDGRGNIQVPPEKMDEFQPALQKLLSERVDVQLEPLPVSLLDGMTKVRVELATVLAPFLVDDAKAPAAPVK